MGRLPPRSRYLMLSVVPIGVSNIMGGPALVSTGNERLLLRCELAGVAVDLALIPAFGPSGAVAAVVAAELVVAITACVYARRVAPMRVVDKRTLAQAVAGAAVAGCAMMLAGRCVPASWGSLAQMATGALVFFGVYACYTALSRRAWRGLRRSGGTV